jgi:hypothetical protein
MKKPCIDVTENVETLSRDFAARLRRHCAKELEADLRGI